MRKVSSRRLITSRSFHSVRLIIIQSQLHKAFCHSLCFFIAQIYCHLRQTWPFIAEDVHFARTSCNLRIDRGHMMLHYSGRNINKDISYIARVISSNLLLSPTTIWKRFFIPIRINILYGNDILRKPNDIRR